jgi:peptidoglycan/LPS O-acetylase OafA/YrhL
MNEPSHWLSATERLPLPRSLSRARLRRLWPESGASNSLPALDGVRAVAVLLVMVYHAWHITPNVAPANEQLYPLFWLRTGVHLFFVLSGFLLFMPYAHWLLRLRAMPSARLFYLRRTLRVGPAYWTALAILGAAAPWTAPRLFDVLAHSTFAFNALPGSLFSINGVFWTMAIEVQFYALLPLLAVGSFVVARRRGALTAAAVLLIGLVIVSALSGFLGNRLDPTESHLILTALIGKWSVSFFLSVFATGAAASIVYVYVTKVARLSEKQAKLVRLSAAVGFVLGTLLAVGMAAAAPYESRYSFGKNILYGLAYGLIVLGVVLGPAVLRTLFESSVLRFVGLISYSLYLWHAVAFAAVSGALAGVHDANERFLLGICLMFMVAIPVAYISYMFAERPFMSARSGLRDDAKPEETLPRVDVPVAAVVRVIPAG